MGDEGWWSGKNEQGEIGNFPSDFVQEIKEDAVQSPTIASTSSFPTPAVAATVAAAAVPSEEPPKSPVHPRLPVHAPVALPAVPTEPLRTEPVRAKTNETPLTTPPPIPRSSRPPSMIASPTSSSAQLNYAGPVHGGPPLPVSPPRRMSTASRSSSSRVPVSPHQANAPDLPNSDRQFLPDEAPSALASIPQDQEDSQETEEVPTPAPQGQGSQEIPAYTDIRVPPHNTLPPVPSSDRQFLPPITDEAPSTPAPIPQDQEGSQEAIAADHSNRSSYILPTPVSRNRPLPPLARPPSIHQITENKRRSVVLPPTAHLPPVPSEAEEAVAQEPETTLKEEEKEKEPEVEEVKPHQEHEEAAPPEHEGAAPPEHDVQVEQEEPGTVVAPGDTEEHAHKEQQEDVPETATTLDTTPAAEADEETAAAVEEKEPEKPKLPEMEGSGPALSHASRPRPAKGRKPPSAPLPNPETSFVSQLEAEVKAAPIPEERKPESTPASANVPPAVEKAVPLPPPKPIKPIFQKFPTPFAGAQPASVSLRPTGRRTDAPQSPVNSSLESSSSAPASTTAAGSGGAPPPAGGVKSLTSRFGQFQGVPASGNNSAVLELEIAKLRRWMTEELDRVKKELADERESREKLQEEVNQLRAQLMG
ncbi:hypothetical protein BC939DRAFT_440205 [Gamsiella multidivaricata]|uniref:uncharacterized protein n=1 Tax=Gamsiella multidivaricata TaxID=101098 RepID=UPI00221FB536|nr:uncharacterized protein BC939DRAFT_440205 [Gamsiella multidivaricata]KAI7830324.1 hypothetical protein BC939DRAFT_440205 [Gamsiella multidivaricata]